MNNNEIDERKKPISLKKQNRFFFNNLKSNKTPNTYLQNLRNMNQIKKSNIAFNINQKYILKNRDLSKLSELNNTNQMSNILNNTCCTVQTAPNESINKKLLNLKKINNINKNIKLKCKHKFFPSLLYKNNKINKSKKESIVKSSDRNNENKKNEKFEKYSNKKNKSKNSMDENNNMNIKNKNIKKQINKKKIKDIINKNNSIVSKTLDDNILNSNYTINSNSTTRKESSDRQKQEQCFLQGYSIKSINLIKENNDKILNRLLLNKDNKNININIKYFYKKNIKNINWIFYNTYNNINTQRIILKKKDKCNADSKKQNRIKIKNTLYQHGKSYNNITLDDFKKSNTSSFSSQKTNLFKNKFYLRKKSNLTLNNSSGRNIAKRHHFKFNNTFNDIFTHNTQKSVNKKHKMFDSHLLSKSGNKRSKKIKNNLISKSSTKNSNKIKNNLMPKSSNQNSNKIKNNLLPKSSTKHSDKIKNNLLPKSSTKKSNKIINNLNNKIKINLKNNLFTTKNNNKNLNDNKKNSLNKKFDIKSIKIIKNNQSFNRKIKSENNFRSKTKDKKQENSNSLNFYKKECKTYRNEKSIINNKKKDINSRDTKSKEDRYKTKKKPINLLLKNKIDIKKIYNNIILKFGLKQKKEIEKQKIKKEKIYPKMLSPNQNDYSYNSNIEDIINYDNVKSNNNKNKNSSTKDYNAFEIESITKRLNFDNINLDNDNIFSINNNKKYNEFKINFDKDFKKKFIIDK